MSAPAAAPQLRRELGLGDGLALVVGITIGAGIFAVPGRVAQYFSSFTGAAAAWLVAAVFALIGSLIYAELGARLPYTGGEYIYIHRAFGALPAFVYGWSQLLAIRTYPTAALMLVCAEYAENFVKLGERGRLAVAALLVVGLGVINYFGLRSGRTAQAVLTILKVAALLALVASAAVMLRDYRYLAGAQVPPQALGPLGNFSSAMLLTIFTFVGWDRVGYLAGEMRDPERNIPRALLGGAAIVAFLYLSVNFFYHAAMPISVLSASRVPGADLARLLWGPAGVAVIALAVMISTVGAQNGNIMASSRVYYAMASDGLFLRSFARVHPRWHSPHVAIAAHCGWAIVLLLASRTVETLVGSYVFSLLILWSAVTLAYFKLRRHGGRAPFEAPGYPWMPALYLVALAAMTVATCYFRPQSAVANLALMASGLPFYLVWRRRNTGRK
ncbi:MAG: amino acid permease [Acidobacteria bacterium]|nr:amino acid permease [Acidobacteriota bacterium]